MMVADVLDNLVALTSTLAQLVGQGRALVAATARVFRGRTLSTSYESLRLDFVLDIQDAGGRRAILERYQQVRFLTAESGVVRDLVWGEGNPLLRYTASGARRLAVQLDGVIVNRKVDQAAHGNVDRPSGGVVRAW
jgi:hypothetical protein